MSEDRGVRAVFDAESNGFLYDTTQVHCLCICDFDTRECFDYTVDDGNIKEGLEHLNSFKLGIGHFISGFDLPLFYRMFGWKHEFSPRDTCIMSRLFFPEQADHSLDYYGRKFKRYKPPIADFSQFDAEMLNRCQEDVQINVLVYEWFIRKELSKWKWLDAIKLEQDFAYDQAMQELVGIDVDTDLAYRCVDEIDKEMMELDPMILETLPMRVVPVGVCNKPFKKDGTLSKPAEDWFNEDVL